MAWFELVGIGQYRHAAPTCARRRRSVSSAGVDPYGMPTAIARFVELLGETCPDLVVHAGAVDARSEHLPAEHRTVDGARSAPSTGSSGPSSSADDLPPLLDPIGFTVVRRRRHPHRRAADLAARLDRRDRRDRGGRPPLRLRPPRQDASRQSVGPRWAHRAPAASPDRCVTCCSASGSPKRCRTRSSRPTRSPRRACDARRSRSPTRWCPTRACCARRCGRGCSERSRSTSRIGEPGARFFEIGHVYPPGDGDLPGEYEALTVVLAGSEAPAAMAVWRELTATLGGGARIDQGAGARRAPRHPLGDAAGRQGPARRGRRGRTRRARGVRGRRAGGDPRARSRPVPRPRAEAGAVEGDEPISVERPRPVVPCSTTRCRRRSSRRRSARAPVTVLVDLDLFDNYRNPDVVGSRAARLPPAPPGGRPQSHRRRHRRDPARNRSRGDKAGRGAAKLTP